MSRERASLSLSGLLSPFSCENNTTYIFAGGAVTAGLTLDVRDWLPFLLRLQRFEQMTILLFGLQLIADSIRR
jgi:hypothetical protein